MSVPPVQSKPLPRLRPELALVEGAPTVTHEPTWLVHDPLQNRYIQIDRPTYIVLSEWSHCRTADELIKRLAATGDLSVTADDVTKLVDFIVRNKLTDALGSGTWKSHAKERAARSHAPLAWLAHNYLFFKLPLWHPQKFLETSLPVVRSAITRQTVIATAMMGALGLYLVSRQWDVFVITLQSYFSWEGAVATFFALAFIKVLHELGHAYSAVHYGCRVPTMGIAFMMMAPMLYTDVTDAWRLRSRKERLVISGAGIIVEFGVAAVCLLLWAMLPDGPLRSVAFVLATTSLVTSLLINLNPLMRFDGYYLLADWLGIENLQDRSFELARWKLRECLFGLGIPCPEDLTPRHRFIMTIYAVCVWIYRLILFIGIALVVYHYFFKVLGIILFCFEIGYFVLRPLWSELQVWYALRDQIRTTRRTAASAAAVVAVALVLVFPWSAQVEIPSVLEPEVLARVHPVRPARIVAVHVMPGQHVEAGAPLLTLASPDLDQELALTRIKLRLAQLRYARRMADTIDREASLELASTIQSLSTKIEGLQREQEELTIRSPLTGRVAEVNPDAHQDRWVGTKEMLALIVADGRWIARGVVSESDLWRIEVGQLGTFVPEVFQRPTAGLRVADISIGALGQLDILDLSSTYSGRVSVAADERRRLVPTSSQYPVRLIVTEDGRPNELISRGVAVVAGRAESLLARAWRKSVTVLLQETGF